MEQQKKGNNNLISIYGAVVILLIILLAGFMIRFFVNFGEGTKKAGANDLIDALDRSGEFNDINGAEKDESVAYRVTATSNGLVYLKSFAFGDISNNKWRTPKKYDGLLDGQYSMDYLTSIYCSLHGASEYDMTITPVRKDYLVPYYHSINSEAKSIQKSDIESIGSVSDTYAMKYYGAGKFTADSLKALYGSTSRTEHVQEEQAYREFVYANYINVPESTITLMRQIIREQGWSKNTDGIYKKVSTYISNQAEYNLNFNPAMNKESDVIVAFLTKYKEGICQHFASSAVLLYRTLGIPARRVEGYCAEVAANVEVEVTGGDAHAWVEVYVDGVGWVPIDPTMTTPNKSDDKQKQTNEIVPFDSYVPRDGADGYYYPLNTKAEGVLLDSRNGGFLSGTTIEQIYEKGYYYTAKVYGYAQKNGSYITFQYHNSEETALGSAGATKIQDFRIFDENDVDITSRFDFSLGDGLFKQVWTELTVVTENKSKKGDGTPLTGKGTTVQVLGNLQSFHSVVGYDYVGTITEYGYVKNMIYPIIEDNTGKDVTDQYGIDESKFGYLHVYEYLISISSSSKLVEYTNEEYTFDDYTISGTRNSNDVFTLDFSSFKNAGTYVNYYLVTVTRNGKDVTQNYEIDYNFGVITIDRAYMYITAGSAQKAYNGEPLECHEYTIDTTITGLDVEVEMPAILTNKGVAENYIQNVIIKDSEGNDITANFNITTYSGTLRVY